MNTIMPWEHFSMRGSLSSVQNVCSRVVMEMMMESKCNQSVCLPQHHFVYQLTIVLKRILSPGRNSCGRSCANILI